MKARLSQCHLTINDDIRSLIGKTREEAMRSLGKLKSDSPTSTAEERLRTIAAKVRLRTIAASVICYRTVYF